MAADVLALGLALALAAPAAWPPGVFVLQAAAQLLLNAYRGLYRIGLSPSVLAELPALLGLALVQWYATAEVLSAYAPATPWGGRLWPARSAPIPC